MRNSQSYLSMDNLDIEEENDEESDEEEQELSLNSDEEQEDFLGTNSMNPSHFKRSVLTDEAEQN